jgi:hypothetical protein
MIKVLLILTLSLMSFSGFAKTDDKKTTSGRKIANEVNNWNSQLLACKNKTQFADFLKTLSLSQSTSIETRFYQSLFLPLIPMEGIVARTARISDKARGFEGLEIQLFRLLYKKTPAKVKHWTAFLDYLTVPTGSTFNTISDMQTHFAKDVAPQVIASVRTLNGLIAEGNSGSLSLSLDLALVIGEFNVSRLRAKERRDFSVTLAELYLIKGYYERFLGLGYYLSSYNLDGATALSQEIGQKYLAQMLVGKAFAFPLFSSKDLSAQLEEPSLAGLFVLKDKTNSANHPLKLAFQAFKDSNTSLIDAVKQMSMQTSAGRFFKLEAPILAVDDLVEDRLKINQSLLSATGAVRVEDDLYTNAGVEVNLSQLFDPTNSRIHDLKKLFPNSSKHYTTLTNAWTDHGGDQIAPNYYLGKKVGLPDPTLGGVLPKIKSLDGLIEAERVLERRQIGLPLLAWMELFI